MAPARRPADLLPDAGPGRRLRPRLGAQDDPPATDEHPRRHHPPHPTHRPPPQNRPPPEHLTARQPPAPPDPTDPIDSTTPAPRPPRSRKKNPGPKKTRPPRPNTRQTTTPTHHNPTHNTNTTTQPHSTNQQKPRPDARFPSSLKKKTETPLLLKFSNRWIFKSRRARPIAPRGESFAIRKSHNRVAGNRKNLPPLRRTARKRAYPHP